MLLFLKQIEETQKSKPLEATKKYINPSISQSTLVQCFPDKKQKTFEKLHPEKELVQTACQPIILLPILFDKDSNNEKLF